MLVLRLTLHVTIAVSKQLFDDMDKVSHSPVFNHHRAFSVDEENQYVSLTDKSFNEKSKIFLLFTDFTFEHVQCSFYVCV